MIRAMVNCMITACSWLSTIGSVALLLTGLACNGDNPSTTLPKDVAAPKTIKKVPAGKNIILEIQGNRRRVVIEAKVCLREGQLEQLLCRRQSKEHEAILAADVDARMIHAALEAAGAKAGRPV